MVCVGWQYNALKTMLCWHLEMWRDSEVKNLYYIVDKPWSGRAGRDGVTLGGRGRSMCSEKKEREEQGEEEVLEMIRGKVARPLREGEEPESFAWEFEGESSEAAVEVKC